MAKAGKRQKRKSGEVTKVEMALSEAVVPEKGLLWVGSHPPNGDLAFEAFLDEMRVVFDPATLALRDQDPD